MGDVKIVIINSRKVQYFVITFVAKPRCFYCVLKLN